MGQVTVYKSIVSTASTELLERGSRFLAFAFPMTEIKEFEVQLSKLKTLHHKARHFCYAYRMLPDGSDFRANDDGEPSGTAGRPILGRIDSFGLTYTGIVVIRYFGGILLGTSGLIKAYKQAAESALSNVAIKEVDVLERLRIKCSIEYYHFIMAQVKTWQGNVINESFDDELSIDLVVAKKLRPHINLFQENNPKFDIKLI